MSGTVIACLHYRNARAMIDWLCTTFGFARHRVIEDDRGGIAHAELSLGSGMIMVGTVREGAPGDVPAPPQSSGGTTQGCYVVVADADALHAKARAAGATIVMDIVERDYGSREFSCRDPEGHLWHIGTYHPWTARP